MALPRLGVKQIVSSSLWITVLVVRVGCIIEAHPSPNNSNGHKLPSQYSFHHDAEDDDQQAELLTAASHSFLSSPRNGLLGGGLISDSIISPRKQSSLSFHHQQRTNEADRKASYITGKGPILETTTSTTASSASSSSASSSRTTGENDDDKGNNAVYEDSCSGKADGYYQNLGSGCTSYFFCAAGYQITYVCPPGSKFNGKRCESNYKCPTTTADGHRISNDCENKANGYYPSKTVGKYFYCFQQAKVIELECDAGKVFQKNKCVLHDNNNVDTLTRRNENVNRESDHDQDDNDATCSQKANGFYQDLRSNCKAYYYCIGGEKHELRCQDEYIFNGDICVHLSRYQCPQTKQTSASSSSSFDHKGSIREEDLRADLGKLPIISGRTSSSEDISYSSGEDKMIMAADKISSTTTMDPSHLLNVP